MYCDAHPLAQVAVAVLVIGGVSLTLRRFGLSMMTTRAPMRTPRFWWMLVAFMGPLGIANRLLFCDGLFLQFAVIATVAGAGIWVGDRIVPRRR